MTSIRRAFTVAEKAEVWERSGGTCAYCGHRLNPFRDFTIDHVTPLCNGGDYSISNLVAACPSCNSSKNGREPAAWRGPVARHRSPELDRSVTIVSVADMFWPEVGRKEVRRVIEKHGLDVFTLHRTGPKRVWKHELDPVLDELRRLNGPGDGRNA